MQLAGFVGAVRLGNNLEFGAVSEILNCKPLVDLTLNLIFTRHKLPVLATIVVVNVSVGKIGCSCNDFFTAILCE